MGFQAEQRSRATFGTVAAPGTTPKAGPNLHLNDQRPVAAAEMRLRALAAAAPPLGQAVAQRTAFDDEIGTLVWTAAFEAKHFAETVDEAVKAGLDRIKTSAFKNSGARPDSNTVIIYDKDLLFLLKEEILGRNKAGAFSFKAPVAIDVSAAGVTQIDGATITVNVNDQMQMDHLASVTGGTLTFHKRQSNSVKFSDDDEKSASK